MAQTIHLKRSSTQHKVPSTGNLALGELAINTYDGRVFFKKNDGSDSIEHIVTTDSITTGSVSIIGSLVVDDITIDGSTISDSGDFTLDVGGDITLDANGADIVLKDDGTAFGRFKRDTSDFVIKSETNDKDIIFKGVDNSSTITALTLDMSDAGSATFNNHVTVGDDCTVTGNLGVGALNASYGFYNNTTSYLNGNTTVNANLTVDAGAISISGDGANATTLTESGTGDFEINTVADIVLDAGGGDIQLRDDGTTFGTFSNSSSDFWIGAGVQDKDIVFRGNDGGSYISALTLDMSNGGSATFRDDIDYGGKITQTGTTANTFAGRVDVDDTTSSTSKTTGALVVDGGIGAAGNINAGGDVVAYASSDERYKDNIIPIRNPNEKIQQIGGYTFDWNDKHEIFKGKKDIGVVAQEIEKVLPEIVETRDNGFKAVKYEKIVALLIESNKELIKRVEELESKVK